MKNEDFEDKAIDLYRSLLKEEISRPELAAEKKAFIKARFGPRFRWLPAAGILTPVAALALLFLYFHFMMPAARFQPAVPQEAPKPVTLVRQQPLPKKFPPHEPLVTTETIKRKIFRIKTSQVKKVSSQVGQTMVYQARVKQKPVTVIWVFSKPGMRV